MVTISNDIRHKYHTFTGMVNDEILTKRVVTYTTLSELKSQYLDFLRDFEEDLRKHIKEQELRKDLDKLTTKDYIGVEDMKSLLHKYNTLFYMYDLVSIGELFVDANRDLILRDPYNNEYKLECYNFYKKGIIL